MIFRLLLGAGLFGMGFYLGRELGRTESLRERFARDGRSTRVRGRVLDSTAYQVVNVTRPRNLGNGRETGDG